MKRVKPMKQFQVAYVPIGVPTFHLESAQIQFEKSIEAIRSVTEDCVFPEEMLLSIDKLDAFLDTVEPDLVILQNITFANAAYASDVARRISCPVLLWTLREPVIDGGRLRLNSLTGAYSAANAFMTLRDGQFEYLFGAPDEARVIRKLGATVRAAKLKHDMKDLTISQVGHTPQGFGFGRAMDTEMQKTFGATVESIEARELINQAKSFTDEECAQYLADLDHATVGLDQTPSKNKLDFARVSKAYQDYVKEHHIGALSSRCWPDFFTDFGTPVCAVLGILNDLGVAASCEADTYGALSMYMGMQLSGKPVFFGDPVSLDESENTVTFWHCGTAACSLADPKTGATIGVHPNRKIGPAMDFGCAPADHVTVFRVGRKADGTFRFFVATGSALEKPKQFIGTSTVVQTDTNAFDLVDRSVRDCWEPHFVVVYDDVKEELETLARMLGVEVCEY